jgi:hypothetical protein
MRRPTLITKATLRASGSTIPTSTPSARRPTAASADFEDSDACAIRIEGLNVFLVKQRQQRAGIPVEVRMV